MKQNYDYRVVVGIVRERGYGDTPDTYLISQRAGHTSFWPDAWEFPGGKVEEGETWEDALKREFAEELGYAIHVRGVVCEREFDDGGVSRLVRVYWVEPVAHFSQTPVAQEDQQAVAWVSRDDLAERHCTPLTEEVANSHLGWRPPPTARSPWVNQ